MVRKFLAVIVFAFFSHSLSATCLSSLRSEVLQKVEVLHSKKAEENALFVARIDETEFDKALDAVSALEQSLLKSRDLNDLDQKNQSTPLLEFLLKQELFLKGLDQLLEEKISSTLKTLAPEEAGSYIVNSVVYKLFFPDESYQAELLETKFNNLVAEVAQFAETLLALENRFYLNSKDKSQLEKKVRELFYSYAEFGDFKNKLPQGSGQRALPRKRSDLDLVTNSVRSIYLQIKYYTEPEPPALIKYRPVEWLWNKYLERRKRKFAKENLEKALVNFAAFDIPIGKEKGQRLCYAMKAVDAFWKNYGSVLTKEQIHYFKVQIGHLLPKIYQDFSINPDIITINGDYVTGSTMQSLRSWSERLDIIVPEYKIGFVTYLDYD